MRRNRISILTFSAAALSAGLFACQLGAQNSQQWSQNFGAQAGASEATQMVSAQAALARSLDARKDAPGEAFRATIADKVHLKDGTELPTGTVLMRTVSKDDLNLNGMSKLALRFTQAKLKDGQVLPIKATIVGVYAPDSGGPSVYPVEPGNQVPINWTANTLQVDQPDAMGDIDLHSRIASPNSGVLVSTKKSDIKLPTGTEFGLAIAGQTNGQASQPSSTGGD